VSPSGAAPFDFKGADLKSCEEKTGRASQTEAVERSVAPQKRRGEPDGYGLAGGGTKSKSKPALLKPKGAAPGINHGK
jgi:hypothetical protein